ncbi:MAG: hypothetical protein H7Y31_16940 [Chitinophagaceae bacterium]|nr:hypothetical protein [Chitinophagaceae bacterium]
MKIKACIWLFVFGFVIDFVGAWMKVTHQPLGDVTIAIAVLFKTVGILGLTVFLLAHPKVKAFLAYKPFDDFK